MSCDGLGQPWTGRTTDWNWKPAVEDGGCSWRPDTRRLARAMTAAETRATARRKIGEGDGGAADGDSFSRSRRGWS